MNFPAVRLILVLFFAVSCAPIEKQQQLTTGQGVEQIAGPGDVIARVEKTRNLKNAFGAADIWGRKTYEGYSELRFAGLSDTGGIVVYRQDLNIETDEDVFTRSGFGTSSTTTTASAVTNGSSVVGTANSNTIVMAPRAATAFAVPTGALAMELPKETREFPFAGYIVEIVKADAVSLRYRLR